VKSGIGCNKRLSQSSLTIFNPSQSPTQYTKSKDILASSDPTCNPSLFVSSSDPTHNLIHQASEKEHQIPAPSPDF